MPQSFGAQPEPEYGAGVAVANSAEAVAAIQPAPGVPPMATEPEAPEGAQPMTEAGPQPTAPGAAGGYTVKNPFMLLPSSVNFPQTGKGPTEARYDAGLLFEVLAQDDPTMRIIAQELMGK